MQMLGKNRIAAFFFVAATVAPFAVHGCRSEKQPQYPATGQQDYTGDAAADTTSPAATTTADAAADAATDAAAAAPPPPLEPSTQAHMLTKIDQRARRAGAGKKVGSTFGGVLREGQTLEQPVNFDPSHCYSVFAAGETGISELDIQVIARASLPLPQPGPTLVVDNTTGPEAAITPCWKNMVPVAVPALVIVKATRGQGPVAAQVYAK